MDVDQHEQAMETDDLNSDDNADIKDGATDTSKSLGQKEKLSKSKIKDCVDGGRKDSNLIVGNGSRDSEDSCDSSKQGEKTGPNNVDGEVEKNSDTEVRQDCVMNGDLSDHSSMSSGSEHDAESEKCDKRGEGVTNKRSSSQNGKLVEDISVDNSEISHEDESENERSEDENKSKDDIEEHKGDGDCDESETSKHNDDSSLDDITDSKPNDESEINTKTKNDNEESEVDKSEVDENTSDNAESKNEEESEVDGSGVKESSKSVESKKDNKSGKSKSKNSGSNKNTSETESCLSKDASEKVEKDCKVDGDDDRPIEINDEDPDVSSSDIMKDKRSIGDILSSKKTGSLSSSSSFVGNPPFIDVTYSARGPVPTITSIGGNSIINTATTLRMVVPTVTSGLSSQTRPQYQNQYQFYLQGPGGSNASQYVSVLNTQAGARNPNRQINNKPMEKIEPPKPPQSSLDMIELSRWEVKQGLHRRARNTKIRPESELSNLARFLRDFGQDLVKEAVYSDLVKIQQKRNSEGKLKSKEADDFKKLKSVHQELHEKVGPCKVQFNQKCSCGFRTESTNVMYAHKQRPHIDGYDMCCAYCSFNTRNPHAFKFHLEGEHNVQPIIEMKTPLWECNLCPYEHNIKNKLTQHKFKCTKNFKLHLNLHPAWMPGPEINFCLENIMYKQPVIKPPQTQLFNKQGVRAQPKIGPRPQAPRANETIQQINAARAQAQQMMKFGGQRPGVVPNVNFFQGTPALQRTPLRNVSSSLTGNRPGFPANRMPTSTNMPILMKPQMRNQTPKMSTVTPKSTTTNVTSKINNLITMNETMLDIASKGQANSGFEICEICGGYVKDRTALRIHFFYAHRIDMPYAVFDRVHPPLYCATCFSRFWTAQGLQKHLDVHKEDSSGGVAGKCVVCGHRVPNILMHMRIVHNKALNNFLKECKCIFCGTSFQNKTIVENHMAAIHGVVVKSGTPAESSNTPRQPNEKSGQASQKSGTALVKGSVCVLCNLNFGRNVDLTRHCMKVHHTCMKCGMVVADKLSLMKHTCLESATGLRNCELCGEKGFHPAYHVKHIRDKHLKKCSVKVKRLLMDKNSTVKVEPGSRSAGRSKPTDSKVIDVDSKPSPIKKYKQCEESARIYRESLKVAAGNDSDSSASKKRKLRNVDNQSKDSSDKPAKKAKTDKSVEQDECKDKTNPDEGSGDEAKPSETDVGDDISKTDSLQTSNKENKMDTSEVTNNSGKSVEKSEKAASDSRNSDESSECNQDKVESETANPSKNDGAKENDGNSSGDEGDGGAFCGFQSLTKPEADADADVESGNSASDSE